jgi:hypothetical protein
VRVGPRYKAVTEKPVIINAGAHQTILPPPAPAASVAATAAAHKLYDDEAARYQPSERKTAADEVARRRFVDRCLADPAFYARWEARLGVLERGEVPAARPAAARGLGRPEGGYFAAASIARAR